MLQCNPFRASSFCFEVQIFRIYICRCPMLDQACVVKQNQLSIKAFHQIAIFGKENSDGYHWVKLLWTKLRSSRTLATDKQRYLITLQTLYKKVLKWTLFLYRTCDNAIMSPPLKFKSKVMFIIIFRSLGVMITRLFAKKQSFMTFNHLALVYLPSPHWDRIFCHIIIRRYQVKLIVSLRHLFDRLRFFLVIVGLQEFEQWSCVQWSKTQFDFCEKSNQPLTHLIIKQKIRNVIRR